MFTLNASSCSYTKSFLIKLKTFLLFPSLLFAFPLQVLFFIALSPRSTRQLSRWASAGLARDAPAEKPKAREPSLMLLFHPKESAKLFLAPTLPCKTSDEQVFYFLFIQFFLFSLPWLVLWGENISYVRGRFLLVKCQKFSAFRDY